MGKRYPYKGHTIIQTSTTTTVYVKASIGYRPAIRYLYKIEGEYDCGPSFTTLADAKAWLTEQINENK